MIVLDTSALVRFFVADDEKKSHLVADLLESKEEILISEAVVSELVFVLSKLYDAPKKTIIRALRFLISRSNISLTDQIKLAVKIFAEENLSIVDCLVLAHAQASEGNKLASFDKKLAKLSTVHLYWN